MLSLILFFLLISDSRPTRLELEPATLEMEVGQIAQAKAVVYDQHGQPMEYPVIWLSGPCVKVSKSGRVTAKVKGKCGVTAVVISDDGGINTCPVRVTVR